MVRKKVKRALEAARGLDLGCDESLESFLDDLPFAVSGNFGGNTTCFEIQDASDDPDEYILFDAGTGIRDFGNAYMAAGKAGNKSTFHIFMSHVHWDHIQGFPFFVPAYIPGNKIIFHGHHQSIESSFRQQMEPPCFPVPMGFMKAAFEFDIRPPGTPFDIAGFHITTIEQKHPGISYGYRCEKDGKIVVISTDSEHKDDVNDDDYPFLDFYRDADVVVFDAQYTFADAGLAKEDWGHSSNLVAVELCSHARVKTLCMVHHEPTASDDALEAIQADTRRYAQLFNDSCPDYYPRQIHVARDAMSLEL
jgi:phosphoribosyl 1,2-cyclic phosphodiesterase